MIQLLRTLDSAPVGEKQSAVLTAALRAEDGANVWPDDDRFRSDWLNRKFYGGLRRDRVLMVLKALELHYQQQRTLAEPLMSFDWSQLTVEHILPQSWLEHWPLDDDDSAADRDFALHGIGNLTLVSGKLNPKMSNAGWSKTKKMPGKHDELKEHSRLELNKRILENYPEWHDSAIERRAEALFEDARKIWPS